MIRRQLPGYSPLRLSDVVAGLGSTTDARPLLQQELVARFGVQDAELWGSGTIALAAALQRAMQRRPGLPIAMPGYACFDLATAALMVQAPVVLYDVDPQTLAPSAASLEAAAAGGIAAIVAVHLYGLPVPLRELRTVATSRDALLIEDAAQGIAASYDGQPLGSWGDLAVLSFGRGKGLTGGGGGALLVKHRDEGATLSPRQSAGSYQAASSGPVYAAKLCAQWALGRPAVYGIPASIPALRLGETLFHEPGPMLRMSAASARVVMRTFPAAVAEADVRRRNAARLLSSARAAGLASISPAAPSTAGWLRFPVLLPDGHQPERQHAAALGTMPGYPRPLRALEAFQPRLERPAATPGADALAARLWTLPTHSLLNERDLESLERWLRRYASAG